MQISFFGVGNVLLHSEAAHGNAHPKILQHVVWNRMGITSSAAGPKAAWQQGPALGPLGNMTLF